MSMPSPFPGMDPYLEDPSVWMDFHESFSTYLRDSNYSVPPAAPLAAEDLHWVAAIGTGVSS